MKTTDEMNIVSSEIVNYLDDAIPESPAPAKKMEEEAQKRDFPIVGPQVGRFLKLLTAIMKPTRVVEMGSGFGYSAFWFGEGDPRTEIHLTEYDGENLDLARKYLSATDHPNRFEYHQGEAFESVEKIRGPINCLFIDLEKNQYPRALDWAEDRLAPGGWLIADNVLWKGKVSDSSLEDEATEAIREFNSKIYEEPWESSILPIRDGLSLSHLKR